jgi:hypothetical protein
MAKLLHKTFQGRTVPRILKSRETETFDLLDKKETLNFDQLRQYVYYFTADMNKRFETLTAMTMHSTIIWDVTPCTLVNV